MVRLLGFLLLLGFIGAYIWQILAAVVVVGLVWWGLKLADQHQALEAQRRAALRALVRRCDQQHAWVIGLGNWPATREEPTALPEPSARNLRFASLEVHTTFRPLLSGKGIG